MSADKAWKIYQEAYWLDETLTKVDMLQQAVDLADAANEKHMAFQIRQALITAATFSGKREIAMVAFSWCRNLATREPGEFDEANLLWSFKWIVASAFEFASLGQKQIFSMLDDLSDTYHQFGYSLRPVEYLRCRLLTGFGHREQAIEAHKTWPDLPRDDMADCLACEKHFEVKFANFTGDFELAIDMSQPFRDGEFSCKSVPHATYAKLLEAYVRLGMKETAHELAGIGYPMIRRDAGFVDSHADYLLFRVYENDWRAASEVFESHIEFAFNEKPDYSRVKFYNACTAFFRGLRLTNQESFKLRIPNSMPFASETGQYDIAELESWFDEASNEINTAFDKRNENSFYSDNKADRIDLALSGIA